MDVGRLTGVFPASVRFEFGTIELSVRPEELSLRRCRRCGWEGPAYLEHCRRCPAVMGDLYRRHIVIVVPQLAHGELPARILAIAALALELSGELSQAEALRAAAGALVGRLLPALPETAVVGALPSGVLVVLFPATSLAESAAAAARGAAALEGGGLLERRAGLAVGLADGAEPWRAAVVERAARLARGAQAGQTLAGSGAARLLDHEWQFGPVGVLPRRQEDAIGAAAAFLGRKRPVSTPSAFAPAHAPGLVGRRQELAVLDGELARAREGDARWCALVGPAGCGKSKLLRSWLGQADAAAMRVVGAAASPFGQAPRALIDQLLATLTNPPAPDAPAERVLATLVAELDRATDERPVLVLIDDLHWADAGSLALLRALSTRPLRRCLVVVALRSSFALSAPWLLERARRLELPSLGPEDREELLHRLLPDHDAAPLRSRLAAAEPAGNPLYLEQAAAYLEEAGADAPLPRSLHEAVLRRLDLVRARIERRGYERPSPEELAAVERTVGEWLDRLETGDYNDRAAIANYLSLLEHIDAALVIAGAVAGVPQRRNRRLTAAIERFYSAGFAERAEAIERFAVGDPTSAADAAARGGERATVAVRLEDACGYLELAARLARGKERGRHLLALGDVLLARGLGRQAWRAYAEAVRANPDDDLRARCERRLARVALARGRPRTAGRLLERALPRLTGHERIIAGCDLALVSLLAGEPTAAEAMLAEQERIPEAAGLEPLILRSRLRLALHSGVGDVERFTRACASALVLEGDGVGDLAVLIDTALLLRQARPALVDPTLVAEARRAATRIGNAAVEAQLLSDGADAAWRPLHPAV